MSDSFILFYSFIMFYSFIVFYSFIRRRWINSFLTFDNFFAISFFMSHSRLHYLNTLHSLLSPQTIVHKKKGAFHHGRHPSSCARWHKSYFVKLNYLFM